MSGLALMVASWGPVILRSLPQIIKLGQDLYALWCSMRGTRQQNDAVLRAMKLLNRHQDDIDRLLQDPQQKRDLLEGLTILMNRINQHGGQAGNLPTAPLSDEDCGAASFSKFSIKGMSWKLCDVCRCEYDTSNRRPTILACGHTFCRDCLREIARRGRLLCPTCRSHDARRVDSLPPNTGLIRVLEEEGNKGDDSCCSAGSSDSECQGISLSYDQQIQYAIFLSQQQAQNRGPAYVASSWREVEEGEDERLAQALQDSEIYEASRLCAQRQQAEGDSWALDPPDKEKNEACGASASHTSEDEEASLLLAFELQEQEMALIQRYRGSSGDGNSSTNDGDCGLMREYQKLFGPSFCNSVEDKQNATQVEENAEDRREKEEEEDRDEGATCCNKSEDEGRNDDGEECGKKCFEDDCGKEDIEQEYLAAMKAQEDLLLQMAINLSLEQHEACTGLTARE